MSEEHPREQEMGRKPHECAPRAMKPGAIKLVSKPRGRSEPVSPSQTDDVGVQIRIPAEPVGSGSAAVIKIEACEECRVVPR